MRLDHIRIENVLGLRSADLALRAPITLVAGPNGAGKSSLQDAVALALMGQPRRVSLKKDFAKMVTDGAKKGKAAIWADGEQVAEFKLPSGDHGEHLPAGAQYLPYVLDAGRFTAATGDERRKLLFQLTGCKASPDVIEARLLELGADKAKVTTIKPLLLSGFPGACKDAKQRATEAKGAWRGVTGEAYGDKKADDWEPELPTTRVDDKELAASQQALAEVAQDLDEAQQTLGGHKAAATANVQRQQRIAELKETATLVERRQIKLNTDMAQLDEWDTKVSDATQAASGAPAHDPLACPHCQGKVEYKAGALFAYVEPELVADPEALRRLPEYKGYQQSALRAVENSRRDLKAAQDAAAQATILEAETTSVPPADAIANAEQMINELRQKRDTLRAKVEALQDASKSIAEHAGIIKKAAQHHADVLAWSLIGDSLAPDGIPAELLSKALTPINTALSTLSALAGWPVVTVSSDMEVTTNGRAFAVLSESEQWRCNTLIALAIAQASGLRLTVLDRFDVLDLPSRGQLLGMLVALAKQKLIDSVIVCGTLKAKPATLPAEIMAVWIENGIAAGDEQLQQAS